MGKRSQRGLSLIELMVAIGPGLLVTAIGTQLLIATLGSGISTLRYARFNQDLRGVLNALARDLERAGTWGLAAAIVEASAQTDLQFAGNSGTVVVSALRAGTGQPAAVFSAPLRHASLAGQTLVLRMPDGSGTTQRYDLRIAAIDNSETMTVEVPAGVELPLMKATAGSWTVLNPFAGFEVSPTCVRYRYDLDLDGLLDTDEYFGFRYDAVNKALEASTTAHSCAGAGWEDVTDPRLLQLSDFSITAIRGRQTRKGLELVAGEYLVRFSGQLQAEAGARRSVQAAIQVRNSGVY